MTKLTQKAVAQALQDCRGNASAVARMFGVTRRAICERIEKDPDLQRAVNDARETRLDVAEDKLGDAVNAGEGWAVCFTLKTQGKGRGYIERTEHEQIGDTSIVIKTLGPGMKMSDLDQPK